MRHLSDHKMKLHHLQGGELMEVGGEQGGAAEGVHEVLADGPGQAEAIVGGCAPAQLVYDHQGALRRPLHQP